MLLLGSEVEKHLKLTTSFHKINQVGIDLSVCKVEQIRGGVEIFKEKTVVLPEHFREVGLIERDGRELWILPYGAYALTFNEGVSIPANATGFITSRSSIYRGGAKINSPIWDPGFETNQMGTTLFVHSSVISIEKNARVCQFYMISNPAPDSLYNGQFQGKVNY
jgi:dUTP pyrophosphatase